MRPLTGLASLGAILLLTSLAAGCPDPWILPSPDAAPRDADFVLPDAGPIPDGGGGVFAAVSISGCASKLVTEELINCRGTVPLSLTFTALASPDATQFLWDFGDDSSPIPEAASVHRYELPGAYRVLLTVGGPFGSVTPAVEITVDASAANLGAWCELDAQCLGGLCLCGPDESGSCPAVLSGSCSADCLACPEADHCTDLSVPDASDLPAWRRLACLPGCQDDGDCARPGFSCRELPSAELLPAPRWQRTCFPETLGDVGDSCVGVAGNLDPAGCLAGRCATLGRFGLCTDDCSLRDCPTYAACAQWSAGPHAGEAHCLARCSVERPCDQDPALGCETADASGDWGFSVLDASPLPGATYCAPRRCATAADCPSGLCDLAVGGFCR